jgi:hypothetical protein
MPFWVKGPFLPFLEPDQEIIKKCCSNHEGQGNSDPVRESEILFDPGFIQEIVK